METTDDTWVMRELRRQAEEHVKNYKAEVKLRLQKNAAKAREALAAKRRAARQSFIDTAGSFSEETCKETT